VRVLLTGGAGFIGQHVLARLLAGDHEVRVLDSLRPDVHSGPWQPPDGVELLVADVRTPSAVDRALAGVEGVVHLAAKVGLGVDIANLPDYASSNDAGTAELLAGMARAGVARLALASSMVVYGEGLGRCPEHGAVTPGPRAQAELAAGRFEPPCPRCGRPLETALVGEDAPIDPRNAYAASKYAQELYASTWARSTGGRVAALRYHNVYGPGMPRDTPYAGVAAIFTSALRRGAAPRVFEDGGQRRDFIHVADVAAATVAGLEHTAGAVAGELAGKAAGEPAGNAAGIAADGQLRAYNVGSGTPRTVGEMASALSRALDGLAPVVTGEYRLGDVRHITADSSRLRAELGWRPERDFEAGMAELAAG
jgi:dTDP-L-rhamnose 4-epimerase